MTIIAVRITKEYILRVEPAWYDPDILSGKGTLEEQICEYEKDCFTKDQYYFSRLEGTVTSVVVIDDPINEDASEKVSEQKDE